MDGATPHTAAEADDDGRGMHAGPRSAVSRPMVRAELLGSHSHSTAVGVTVHVWLRDGKYIARGCLNGRHFGQQLGSDAASAAAALRHMLTDLDRGAFRRPSEEKRRALRGGIVPQLDLRQLCSDFLAETRQRCGKETTQNYASRLAAVLDFAEMAQHRRRWPLARDINREFAIELRSFLVRRRVTPNGRPGATPRTMSERHVINCLEALRTALAWAARADVRKLPPDFVNPLTHEVIGRPPPKDPLRAAKLPVEVRTDLVARMDDWQFLHLAILLVLPLRPEDLGGILIEDVDFAARTLRLGPRFGGADYNKGHVDVLMPLPEPLVRVFEICRAGRAAGPLLRSRAVWTGRRRVPTIAAPEDVARGVEQFLLRAPAHEVQAPQDRKRLVRRYLAKLGAVTPSEVGKETKTVLAGCRGAVPYDIRRSVSQDMQRSGMRFLELRYLTEHAVGDIMNDYVGLDPIGEMTRYWATIEPLLEAIAIRAAICEGPDAQPEK